MKSIRPCDCKCMADVLSLHHSYKVTGIRYGMMIQHDGAVVLTDHTPGREQKASITIPRAYFQKLVEWYHNEQFL